VIGVTVNLKRERESVNKNEVDRNSFALIHASFTSCSNKAIHLIIHRTQSFSVV